jgi:hypothetical protein
LKAGDDDHQQERDDAECDQERADERNGRTSFSVPDCSPASFAGKPRFQSAQQNVEDKCDNSRRSPCPDVPNATERAVDRAEVLYQRVDHTANVIKAKLT